MKKIYTDGLKNLVVALAKKQTAKKAGFVAGLLLAFGLTSFSQTNYYVRLDSMNAAGTAIVKNKLDLPAYWTSDPSGKGGSSPADFVTANQIFNVQSSGFSVNAPLVISGTGSKLVVGTADSAVTFTLGNNSDFSGTVDVYANKSTFYIQQGNTSTISLGSLGTGSTVRFAGNSNGVVQQVIPFNYYNLSVAANSGTLSSSVSFPTATVGIAGGFTTRLSNLYGSTIEFNGSGSQTIPAGTYYNLKISGTKAAPDSLKGTVFVAGEFTNTSNLDPIPYTRTATATTGNTLNFSGLKAQSVGNDKTFFNVTFSEGVPLNVTAFDYANSTITLAQTNGDLQVGQKISTNALTAATNNILLDTATTITAIKDSIITLSSPVKIRYVVTNGPNKDAVYATSYDATNNTLTLDPSINYDTLVVNDPISGPNLATTAKITAITANVFTLTAGTTAKPVAPFFNAGVLGLVAFRNATYATKTISGNLHLIGTGAFNSSVPVATEGSTVILEGQGNRIGGGNNWSYNNLLINQVAAASTVVSAPAYVSGNLTLQSGKVTSTSSARYLILNENATFTTPSVDSNYVSCPFAKKFNSTTPFTYYVGGTVAGAGSARRVTITPRTADAKTYTVTFATAKTPNSTRLDAATINSIDLSSNYNVVLSGLATGGDNGAKISFTFNPLATYIDSSLVLAHYYAVGTDTSYKAESGPIKFDGTSPITLTTLDYDTTFGRYVFGTAGPILVPVKLSAVVATALANKTIKINWSSANELSVAKYTIEASTDGVKFSAKGSIVAKGSSDYSFIDASPVAGINYYRIKATDIDGKTIYSSVVSAKQVASISSISVYPNPVKNKQLSFAISTDAANYTLKVTNILGKTVVAKTIAHVGGTANYKVSLPASATAGTYFVELSNGNSNTTKTIVVE